MRTLIVVLLLTLFPLSALAAEVSADLSWTAPTTRKNGEPIDPSEIAEYRLYSVQGVSEEFDTADYLRVSGAESTTASFELQPRAEPYIFRFAVTAVDVFDLESELSNVVMVEFVVSPTSPLAPPTNVQLNFSCAPDCQLEIIETQ